MPAVLSDLERKILDYMVQYLRTNTYQPSIREIGQEFGIRSTKTVSEHLSALAEKGYLERNPSRSRGVRILDVDLAPNTVSVPCYGALPDRGGEGRRSRVESHFAMDRRLCGAKGAYLVRVHGDEYQAAGLRPGDLLLVEPTDGSTVGDGDLVAVRTGEGSALFRVHGGAGSVTLEAGADGSTTEVDDLSSLEITGRVSAVHRRLDGTGIPRSPVAH